MKKIKIRKINGSEVALIIKDEKYYLYDSGKRMFLYNITQHRSCNYLYEDENYEDENSNIKRDELLNMFKNTDWDIFKIHETTLDIFDSNVYEYCKKMIEKNDIYEKEIEIILKKYLWAYQGKETNERIYKELGSPNIDVDLEQKLDANDWFKLLDIDKKIVVTKV